MQAMWDYERPLTLAMPPFPSPSSVKAAGFPDLPYQFTGAVMRADSLFSLSPLSESVLVEITGNRGGKMSSIFLSDLHRARTG